MSHKSEPNLPPYEESPSRPTPPPYQPNESTPTTVQTPPGRQLQAPPYSPRETVVPEPQANTVNSQSPAPPSYEASPNYTNNSYYGESSRRASVGEAIQVFKPSEDFKWILATPSTMSQLSDKAVIGGYESFGTPLWVIRARYNGSWIPGKLSLRTNTASIAMGSKEVNVQNYEVLCARPENYQWTPGNKGNVPSNAVIGGKTLLGMTLYVGRAMFQQTVVPGYVYSWKKCCNIGFGGRTVSLKSYEVLCRIR